MLSVTNVLGSYSVSIALCVRTHFFFQFLLRLSKTTSEIRALNRAKTNFFKGEFKVSYLSGIFKKTDLEKALKYSTSQCIHYAEERCTRDDETMDMCSVCLEERANYYILHSGTVHKCVCAKCAMSISIKDNPNCPICRQPVSLMVETAPRVEKCTCLDKNCSSFLLMSANLRSIAECTTCTLDKELQKSSDIQVYKLFK